MKTYTRKQAIDILKENMRDAMVDSDLYFDAILLDGFSGFNGYI